MRKLQCSIIRSSEGPERAVRCIKQPRQVLSELGNEIGVGRIISCIASRDGMVPPRTGGKAMKLQIFAITLQIITVVALVANIVHHW